MSEASRLGGVGNKLAVLAGVLALLFIGAAATGGCGLFGGLSRADKANIVKAEGHYAVARSAIATASALIARDKAKWSNGAYSDIITRSKNQNDKLVRTLAAARKEIVAARASIGQLPDSQPKGDYLASLASLADAAQKLEEARGELVRANFDLVTDLTWMHPLFYLATSGDLPTLKAARSHAKRANELNDLAVAARTSADQSHAKALKTWGNPQ